MVSNQLIKDHWREQRMFAGRLLMGVIVVLGLLGLVVARLVQLQVGQYDHFAAQSQGNRIRVQPIPPIRGLILDRNGQVMAENNPIYQLEMTREQVPDMEDTLRRLIAGNILRGDDLPEIRAAIRQGRGFDTVVLAERLSDAQLAAFAVNRPYLPGLELKARLGRSYPFGPATAHVLGYVGGINAADKSSGSGGIRGHHPHRQSLGGTQLRNRAPRRFRA